MPDFTLTDFANRKWGDARRNRLEFAHVYCRAGSSHTRVSAVIEAFRRAAADDQGNGNVAITYLLHCTADVEIATSRYQDILGISAATGNTFTFTTFAAWKERDVGERHMLLLDTNRGTTSSIDTLVMLDISQKLGARAEEDGFQCLAVSVSGDPDPLVWRDGVSEVHGYKLEGDQFHEVQHASVGERWGFELFSLALERLRRRQEEVDGVAMDQLHLLGEDRMYGPTLVLLMRYSDAVRLYHLIRRVWPVEFGCIMPWSSSKEIRQAISPSPRLKLIYIDGGVTTMPLIRDSEVLIGPLGGVLTFDTDMFCTIAIPDARLKLDRRLQAAFSLSSPPPAVHAFVPHGDLRCDGPSPAFGSQLPHLLFFSANACDQRRSIDLPIKLPDNQTRRFETVRRLGAWGLVDCDEGAIQKIKHPLGTRSTHFSRYTSNINAAVLLGCIHQGIHQGMSNATANVLIDMAVLVCQGPSSIFTLAIADLKTRLVEHLGSIEEPLLPLAHRGQLWLSVAVLNACRRVRLPEVMWPLLRLEVLQDALARSELIREQFLTTEDDGLSALTEIGVQAVELRLARSFLFNIVLTDMSGEYFAVDFISGVVLSKHEHDILDWEKLRRDSDTPGVVAGIYTYLERSWDGDAATAADYTARDVTIISLKAVAKALREVPAFESLRPSWKPVRAKCVQLDQVDRYFDGFELTYKDTKHQSPMLNIAVGQDESSQPPDKQQPPMRSYIEAFRPLMPTDGMESTSQRLQHIFVTNGSPASFGQVVSKQWHADSASGRSTWAVVNTELDMQLLKADLIDETTDIHGQKLDSGPVECPLPEETIPATGIVIMTFERLVTVLFTCWSPGPAWQWNDTLGSPTVVMDFAWGDMSFYMAFACPLLARVIEDTTRTSPQMVMACTVSSDNKPYFGKEWQLVKTQEITSLTRGPRPKLQFRGSDQLEGIERQHLPWNWDHPFVHLGPELQGPWPTDFTVRGANNNKRYLG